jgi:hypothetical protein
MDQDAHLLERLQEVAKKHFDGHFTVMKFTTNWRVGFGTPFENYSYDRDYVEMEEGKTFQEAATKALNNPRRADCITLLPGMR